MAPLSTEKNNSRSQDKGTISEPTPMDLEKSPKNLQWTTESPSVQISHEEKRKDGCCKYSSNFKVLLPIRCSRKKRGPKMPYNKASLFGFASLHWLSKLMIKAYRKGLNLHDLWHLQDQDTSRLCTNRLERLWKEKQKSSSEEEQTQTLWKASLKFIRTRVLATIVISFIMNLLSFFATGIMMKVTLDYVNESYTNYYYATGIVVAVLASHVLRTTLFSFCMIIGSVSGTRLVGALQGMLFRKLVHMRSAGDKVGANITNIVSNDLERIIEAILSSTFLTTTPLLFSLILGYSMYVIGPWALLGLSVYLFFFPIMGGTGKLLGMLRLKTVKQTDRRVSLMTDIINNLKLIKMYAWEEAFAIKISDVRKSELKLLKIGATVQATNFTMIPCTSICATVSTFLGYTLSGQSLTSSDAFTIFALFETMQGSIALLPYIIRSFAEGRISINRIQGLLDRPIAEHSNSGLFNNRDAVQMKNASFYWESEPINEKDSKASSKPSPENSKADYVDDDSSSEQEPLLEPTALLKGINFTADKNRLIGICGSIGSGKSSLISAICGDMVSMSGNVHVNGRLALVTQQPWIFNSTLRENILVGAEYDQEKFKKTVEVCSLKFDLGLLPNGDLTEIGERGVNLSGGQKQRVNLARAVYSDRDIYLLDDPLSAVDTKVAKHIFNKCITEQLSSKTVLLVTHAVHFLEKCDEIVFMKNGCIYERGTHRALIKREGEYHKMMGYDANANDQQTPEHQNKKVNRQFSRTISHEEEADQTDDVKLTTEETMEIGGISNKVIFKFLHLCGGWLKLPLVGIVIIFYSLSRLFSLVWLRTWLDAGDGLEPLRLENMTLYNTTYDDHELKGNITDNENLWIYQIVYGFSFLLLFVAGISKSTAVTFRVLAGASKLHKAMFNSLMKAPMAFLDSTPTGRILNRFSKDMDEADVRIPFYIDFVSDGLLAIIGQATLVCVMFPLFVIPFAIIAVLFIFVDRFMVAGLRDLKRIEGIGKSPVIQQIVSVTNGLPVIRTLDKQDIFIDRFHKSVDDHSAANLVFRFANRWFTYRTDVMASIISCVITAICVFSKGSVSTATAGVALASVNSITGFISFIMRMKSELVSRFTSVERMMEYAFDVEAEAALRNPEKDPVESWPAHGEICFEKVQMRYRPDLPLVLKELNISVKPHEKIGVVGRTGAGKSSLITCLLRLVEIDGGTVRVDGCDISQIGLHTLRSRISVIPQDPVLFQGTLRYNLDPFDMYNDEQLWVALERSHLKKAVQKFPNQLWTQVEGGGKNFSVGEKQLICLTRALLRHNKILVLDEATASVDVETDHLIQQTIQEEFSDCTVLTIAHRLNTVASYDRILVMDAGAMKEFDTPTNLMEAPDSLFRDMMKAMGVYTIDHLRLLS